MNSMNKNIQPTPSSCSIYNQHYTFGLERVSRRRNSISSSDFLNLFYGIPCMALNQQDIVSLVPVDISPFHCLNKSVRKLSLCIMQEDCQCYFMCSFFCFLAFSAVVHRNNFILLIFLLFLAMSGLILQTFQLSILIQLSEFNCVCYRLWRIAHSVPEKSLQTVGFRRQKFSLMFSSEQYFCCNV